MKILLISMPSIHAVRWIENLKDTPHELYWFDVLDRGHLKTISEIHQFTTWKKRKLPYIKGEYWLRKNILFFYELLQPFMEVTANEQLEKIIRKINPDIIHSFEMQSCSYPILKTMNNHPDIKWVYSCWGNDLYYYQNFKNHNSKIRLVLERVNFLHTDCLRDFELAKVLGFKGKYLGVIPGGTGYDLKALEKYKKTLNDREIILVKGYHHRFGRGLNIVKALKKMQSDLQDFEVVIFGAHSVVTNYIYQNKLPFRVYERHDLKHKELLELMGRSIIYIGNSISDGLPNTLLEAVVMGAFPIQSNPGGATAEIIIHEKNGLLISNPEDTREIIDLIYQALHHPVMIKKSETINTELAKNRFDYDDNRQKVIALYQNIEK